MRSNAVMLAIFAATLLAACQPKEEAAAEAPATEAPAIPALAPHSTEALFGEADGRGAPPFREGLWIWGRPGEPDDCAFDLDADAVAWPDCVRWVAVIGGHEYTFSLAPGPGDPGQWRRHEFQLGGLWPVIAQTRAADGYLYAALANIQTDDIGRMVHYDEIELPCPSPTEAQLRAMQGGDPLEVCLFEDRDALMAVAAPVVAAHLDGRAEVMPAFRTFQWVRDLRPDEEPPID